MHPNYPVTRLFECFTAPDVLTPLPRVRAMPVPFILEHHAPSIKEEIRMQGLAPHSKTWVQEGLR